MDFSSYDVFSQGWDLDVNFQLKVVESVFEVQLAFESWTFVDPAFRFMRFPLDGELDFYLKNWFFYWLFENDLESPLIFVLFLKG